MNTPIVDPFFSCFLTNPVDSLGDSPHTHRTTANTTVRFITMKTGTVSELSCTGPKHVSL